MKYIVEKKDGAFMHKCWFIYGENIRFMRESSDAERFVERKK